MITITHLRDMCIKGPIFTNHLKNRTMENLNGKHEFHHYCKAYANGAKHYLKWESLKETFKKVNARRIAVVQQPSVSVGYIEISYACSANTLFYEVKRHPISGVMTLYLYPDTETMMHHIPKARVYQCVITDLALIAKIIKRIHKVNRPLHNWGTPYYVNVKPLDDRRHPTDSKLLDKIAELRDWACEMGYPLHEVLADEYDYYVKSFKELRNI